jgi:hypothetical protein
MNNIKKAAVILGVGLFSTAVISESAFAEYHSRRARNEIRQDVRDAHRSRSEFRDNVREFQQDRAELRRDLRRGAPAGEIARGRAEVRESRRDLHDSRREFWRDRAELNRHMDRYGDYGGSYGDWRRRDYGWHDNNRWDRDRSGWWGWRNWWR